MGRTLVLIKPDGVERKLIGDIINVYESKDLDITALKMIKVNREIAEQHYSEHKGKPFYEELIQFLTQGRLCAMVIEGEDVVDMVRSVNGNKDPLKANMASIRGRFSNSMTKNLVHASDNDESAEREIKLWFPEL